MIRLKRLLIFLIALAVPLQGTAAAGAHAHDYGEHAGVAGPQASLRFDSLAAR